MQRLNKSLKLPSVFLHKHSVMATWIKPLHVTHYSTLFVSFQLHRPLLPFLAKNHSNVTLQNNASDSDISGRHFLFDKRWRNGTYFTNGIEGTVFIPLSIYKIVIMPETFIVSLLVHKWGKKGKGTVLIPCVFRLWHRHIIIWWDGTYV